MAFLTRGRCVALVLLAAALAIAGGACFSPHQPACAFSCVTPPHACPENYTCGDDGFCHHNDAMGTCLLDHADAAADGADGPDGM